MQDKYLIFPVLMAWLVTENKYHLLGGLCVANVNRVQKRECLGGRI